MVIFDPEHNGLRHGQPALVGLKNRRNTCYINAMLQQLFFIPEFHRWLEESDDVGTVAAEARSPAEPSVTEMDIEVEHGGHKELSDRLQELFRYLRHSKQRFFDPGEFIKACKSISRQPPLLDQAHTQDDTMTFLESLIDALSSVHHGTAPTDLLKVVEKDRRWVDGSSPKDHRSITGREKEYLMLEIEDGIGNLESALRKHFSEELMTGDNRIWNEKTQSKETVWKAPFIEETSLPEVLVVQLKRFKYNMTWDGRMEPHKLNTKVEFGNVLDLSGYVRRQKDEIDAVAVEDGSHIYDLQGLVVHSGQTVHSGHYYSFINWHKAGQADDGEPDDGVPSDANPNPPPQNHQQDKTRGAGSTAAGSTPGTPWEKLGLWYKLDDDMVTEVSEDVVKEESFGGTVESKDQYGDIKRHINSRSAYVLFYRKRRQALATLADEKKKRSANDLDYPAHRAAPCFQPQDKDACSSKRQRAGKADKQPRGNTRDASAMQLDSSISDTTPQARRSGSLKREHSHTSALLPEKYPSGQGTQQGSIHESQGPHELTHSCCASAERASLAAAQHSLAFDQDFMLWIRDLASYAHKSSLSPPKSGSDSPQMLRATEDAAIVYNTQSAKGVLMQVNSTVSPKGSSSSSSADRDLTNMERAIASGVC
jgi:ubiquitin C-terminal hydrolase